MFLSIMEQCIPKKVLPSKRRNLPWLNKHLIQSMRRRNCLFRNMKRSNNLIYKKQYKWVRNNVTYQLRQAKKKYFQNLNPSNAKHFWKTVKTLSKPNNCVSFLTHNGNPCSSDSDKANAMNDFLSKCFNISYPPISTTAIVNHQCSPEILCTVEEVYFFLKDLDISKASGPDGISARMLKLTAEVIAPSVTTLFNYSIMCCRPPSSWKCASVVPIPKVLKTSGTADFRPISLLPILSKVLERHFYLLVNEYLSISCPLSNCQWGFQSGKSTVSALLDTTYTWFQLLEKNEEVGAVFFDFKKTFDSVPHSQLLSMLEEIGLNPCIVSWIHSYLAKREQYVMLNGVSSNVLPVTSGVPQWSILGPLLFLIYIDDISKIPLSPGSRLVLYADDILLYHPISSTSDYHALQAY